MFVPYSNRFNLMFFGVYFDALIAKSAAKTLVALRQEEKKKRISRKKSKKDKNGTLDSNQQSFDHLQTLSQSLTKMANKLFEEKPNNSNIDNSNKMFDFVEAIEPMAVISEADVQLLQRVAYKPQSTELLSKHFARLTKNCSEIPDDTNPDLLDALLKKLINICKGMES